MYVNLKILNNTWNVFIKNKLKFVTNTNEKNVFTSTERQEFFLQGEGVENVRYFFLCTKAEVCNVKIPVLSSHL